MAITKAIVASTVTVTETPPSNAAAVNPNTGLTWDQFNKSLTLTPTSTPPVTKDAFEEVTLSGGAATIDLTALLGGFGAAVSISGLKARVIRIENKSTNSGPMLISKGASNGYTPVVADAFNVPLPVGGYFDYYDGGAGATVGSGAKTLDVAGTGTDVLRLSVLGGA